MGTWGAGNFQSDGALDYVGDVTAGLCARIESVMSDEILFALDEEAEAVIPPTVTMLTLLCDRCGAAPPEPGRVLSWREKYLSMFDREIGDLDPAEGYGPERRATLIETFDALLSKSKGFWGTA